jgi:3-deoxy-7-phosphoheptulonate synthase
MNKKLLNEEQYVKRVRTMTNTKMDDINVLSEETLITPEQLKARLPMSDSALKTVSDARQTIKKILRREDKRLFLVVGPCSIHDVDAAKDYAARLKILAEEVSDTLFLVMRVYFEKPRTTVGWKGFINDPQLDDSFNIAEGLQSARKLLIDLSEMGVPTSTEALDPISPQFLQDIISWSAIGARTTESQTHREMASGLSSSVGFKNGTDGGLEVAINAMQSVSAPHRFLGINHQGEVAVIHTRGNAHAHIVLRGGGGRTNFDASSVAECEHRLLKADLPANIMIDCSHANSSKDHERQKLVMEDVAHQISEGNNSIIGFMVESHINSGNQKVPVNLSELKYGVSITDACVDWETTEKMIRKLRNSIKDVIGERIVPTLDMDLEKTA